jgi:hypothetical protein
MKKVKMVVVAVFAVVVLAACGESDISKVEKVDSVAAAETTNVEATEPVETEAVEEVAELDLGIGDTVKFDGLEVTLNSVHTSMGADFFEPDNAYYVVLNVSISNTTDKSEHISSLMNFKLVDEEGYSQEIGIFVDTKGSLDGEIGAGRSMRGEIAFDAYESDTYEFIFENPFTSGQAIFTFKASEMQ